MVSPRFHGRYESEGRVCQSPGCDEPGEFRAPGWQSSGADGPGEWRWFCLEHVREFNARYDWFAGMTRDEILRAQSPLAGWEQEVRSFRPDAGIDGTPRWADYIDPLEAISGRARDFRRERESAMKAATAGFSTEERLALEIMGLDGEADRTALRRRYSELVRRYHPDRNGGDRSQEALLGRVVDAYQLLRKSSAFA